MTEEQQAMMDGRFERSFVDLYTKFKMCFYREMFARIGERETSLTTTEMFCVEIIYDLGSPTISEFAQFLQISAPNAAYKVNSLIKKGYVTKVQSETDHREYHLQVTDRFIDYYKLCLDYVDVVGERMREKFDAETLKDMEDVLIQVTTELTPEVDIPLRSRGERPC